MSNKVDRWQDAEKGKVNERVITYVADVESAQSEVFERFLKFACLYDPYEQMGYGASWFDSPGRSVDPSWQVSENVCASNVDTVAAIISRHLPRVRFMTDGGNWSTQRQARRLEWYAEGLIKTFDIYKVAQSCFKDCAIFGTGLAKVYDDGERICIERVLVDEIVVDEGECKAAAPRQMHQRKLVNRDLLEARFPEMADEIARAQKSNSTPTDWRLWADYRPLDRDQLVVIESWQLPYGMPGEDSYIPGRHTIVIDGADLLDEEWEYTYFPIARLVWSEPTTGWYGIGLVERIAGHQRQLNKLNWQIDRQMDQLAVPTTYVTPADNKLRVQDTNRLGTIAVYRGAIPETRFPTSVSTEQWKRLADVKASAFEESGVSRMLANSVMPSGIESAVAQREYKDTTTERFALQEQAYERFIIDIVWLTLAACKRLGKDAPRIVRKSRAGEKVIHWKDVDMVETKVSMAAANNISRSPAGRQQTVIEWAQAGIVSQDEARRLMSHPDLEKAMSLYTAQLEDIERCIEDILDGDMLVPEPYQNLQMGLWRFQMSYLEQEGNGAPEDVLEGLRQWMNQAAWVLNPMPIPAMPLPEGIYAQQPIQGMAGQPGMPGMMPSEQMGPALAPQAMNLQPGADIAG